MVKMNEEYKTTTHTFYTITADINYIPSLRPVSAYWSPQPDEGNVTKILKANPEVEASNPQ